MTDNSDCTDIEYIPEKLALKLLMDDLGDNFIGNLYNIMDTGDDALYWQNNKISFLFETLLIICMEMVFYMAMLMNDIDIVNDNSGQFIPNMKQFNIDDFYTTLKSKFDKINVDLHIDKFSLDETDEYILQYIVDNRYCRTILKYSEEDVLLFYNLNIQHNVYYHNILNKNYDIKNKLDDFYTIINLNVQIWKISFCCNNY